MMLQYEILAKFTYQIKGSYLHITLKLKWNNSNLGMCKIKCKVFEI